MKEAQLDTIIQHDDKMRASMDRQYGEGASVYIGRAIEAFYRES